MHEDAGYPLYGNELWCPHSAIRANAPCAKRSSTAVARSVLAAVAHFGMIDRLIIF
jgi:hypothetical protein